MGLMMDEPNAKAAQGKVGYKIVNRNGAAAVDIAGKICLHRNICKNLRKIKADRRVFRNNCNRCCNYSSCIF